MKVDDLLIPAQHVDLFFDLMASNGGFEGLGSKNELRISKETVIELFVRLGAVSKKENEEVVSENEKMKNAQRDESKGLENQLNESILPQAILDKWTSSGENLIRTILDHKDLQAKVVADRYGGKSAAANISNFLAKTDAELATMRVSTMERLAEALECPAEWILLLKGEALGKSE